MATWLKQSTAVEIKLGPFVDQTDGFTAEVGLTIAQADVRLAKNGGDWAQKAETTTLVHEENGWYRCLLDTTDTATLGILIVAVNESGALPVWREFLVVAANIYDSLLGGGDVLDVSVTQWLGTAAATPTVAGVPEVDVTHWRGTAAPAEDTAGYPVVTVKDGTGAGEIDTASGRVAITETQIDQIVDEVLDEDMTAHQVQGTLGQAIGDPVADTNTIYKAVVSDAAGATVALDVVAVQADTNDIQTRLPAALVGGRMDSSVGAMAADVLTAAALATDAVTEIVAAVWAAATRTLTALGFTLGAADLAPDTIGASELAADAVAEIAAAVAAPSAAAIADAVLDEDMTAHQVQGTLGQAIGDPVADTKTIYAAVVSDAAGASVGLDVVAAQVDLDDIQTRLPAALVGGRMDSSVGAMAADVLTAAALATDAVTEIVAAVWAAATRTLTALGFMLGPGDLAPDTIGASELAADAVAEIQSGLATSAAVAAVQADTDNIQTRLPAALVGGRMDSDVAVIQPNTIAAGTLDPTAGQELADALLDRVDGVESGFTVRQSMRLGNSSLVGKLSGAATPTVSIRDPNDTKNRIVATVDADGNRSAVVLDAT